MLRASKSGLQLNSYKLDSRTFEDRLKQLTEENDQLQTSLRQLTLQEHRLKQQLTSA